MDFNQIRFHRIKKRLLLALLCLTIALTGLTLTQAHTAHAEDPEPNAFESLIKPTGLPGPKVYIEQDDKKEYAKAEEIQACLLYTSPSPRD